MIHLHAHSATRSLCRLPTALLCVQGPIAVCGRQSMAPPSKVISSHLTCTHAVSLPHAAVVPILPLVLLVRTQLASPAHCWHVDVACCLSHPPVIGHTDTHTCHPIYGLSIVYYDGCRGDVWVRCHRTPPLSACIHAPCPWVCPLPEGCSQGTQKAASLHFVFLVAFGFLCMFHAGAMLEGVWGGTCVAACRVGCPVLCCRKSPERPHLVVVGSGCLLLRWWW